VYSNSLYLAAAPLRSGGVRLTLEFEPGSTRLRAKLVPGAMPRFCRLHAPQAFELVRCAGETRGGRACKITSMAPFPDAAPLRAGQRFCTTHAYQACAFVRCAGETRSGARCQTTSWQDHAGARPLREGQPYCAKHTPPAASSMASAAQQCEPCDEANEGHVIVSMQLPEYRVNPVCAACGDRWDLHEDPEDAGVWYCGRCWHEWETTS